MKIQDLLDANYTVYVDLDGVLADFDSRAKELTGIDMATADKSAKNKFWKNVEKHVADGGRFFGEMDMLPDAKHLWQYVLKFNPIILSATGHIRGAGDDKRNWVKQHLGSQAAKTALFVRDGKDKAKYATQSSILIDDRAKAIDPWIAAGGIGILHKTAADTISQLKKLGLK